MLYLDYSATTPIHPDVKEIMLPFLFNEFGNPSSKYYEAAINARSAVENARTNIASLLKCRSDEIIFTSGSTESNNFVIKGIVNKRRDKGKHIITTNTEHPSVLEVFKFLESEGFEVTILEVDKEGRISTSQFNEACREDTIFSSIQWGNSEIGSLNPILEISKICKEKKVFLHSDATQVIGKIELSLEDYPGLHAISISAHKFAGPKGVGATFLRRDQYNLLPSIMPLLHGGGQEEGLRSGTLAVHNIVGMGKAAEIALKNLKINIEKLNKLEEKLIEILNDRFGSHIKYNQPQDKKIPGIVNVQFIGLNNEILVKKLSPIVAVSTGSACSSSKPSYVLSAIGLNLSEVRQSIRISIGPNVSVEELNIFKQL